MNFVADGTDISCAFGELSKTNHGKPYNMHYLIFFQRLETFKMTIG